MRPIRLEMTPEEVAARWPAERGLACLWSGPDESSWSRYVVLGEPNATHLGDSVGTCVPPSRDAAGGGLLPGWIGSLSYELGGLIEPRARREAGDWPLAVWQRLERGLVFDRRSGGWMGLDADRIVAELRPSSAGFSAGPLRSVVGRRGFERGVSRVIEYIRGGDVYQVNLAHALEGGFEGSPRALFAALMRSASPWFGGYIEIQIQGARRAVCSASPELFLSVDAAGRVVTRPMKGTRPAAANPAELDTSAKDRAELNMIIDLMRNDLGRVCDFGSVRVERERQIERHGGATGVWQATADVTGRLRAGLGLAELIRAAFPPGSVTGAPKVRAMEIINELEGMPRGPYCGAFGLISDTGAAMLNVAIRTAHVSMRAGEPGRMVYWVGAGIVADSDPAEEWRETMAKAGALAGVASIETD